MKHWFLGLGLLSFGCGDGSIAIDDLDERGTKAICTSLVECGEYPDAETCQAATNVFRGFLLIKPDIEAGVIEYDGGAAKRCVNAIQDFFTCELRFGEESGNAVDEVCDDVLSGTVPADGACAESDQCADGFGCLLANCEEQCCSGTCVDLQVSGLAGINESCAGNRNCVDDAYCNAEEVCTKRPGVGESCSLFTCAEGSICDIDIFSQEPGICVKLSDEGEECDGAAVFPRCLRSDNFCDPTDQVCKPLLAVGSACRDFQCVKYATCIDGTCQARPTAGQTCTEQGPLRCLGSLQCQSGRCALPEETYCSLSE